MEREEGKGWRGREGTYPSQESHLHQHYQVLHKLTCGQCFIYFLFFLTSFLVLAHLFVCLSNLTMCPKGSLSKFIYQLKALPQESF